MNSDSRHQCLIYDGPPSQKLPILAAVIKKKLIEGYRCLYLNSPPMVAGMRSTLSALDIDVAREVKSGRLKLSSALGTTDEFNSKPFLNKLETMLDEALADGYNGLWASGDMTWEFGPNRDFSKLLDYELELEELFARRKELCGICQYHQDTLPKESMRQSLLVHPSVFVNDTLSRINPHYLKYSWAKNMNSDEKLDDTIETFCGMQ